MFGFFRRTYDVIEATIVAPSDGGRVRAKPLVHRWAAYPTMEIGRRLTAGLDLKRGELVRMKIAMRGARVWVAEVERFFGDAA
jgi:hypothetical protein